MSRIRTLFNKRG